MDWLLSHEATLQSYAVLGTFIVIGVLESLAPRRDLNFSVLQRWITNIGLVALGAIFVRWCLPVVAISVALFAGDQRWSLFNAFDIPFWIGLPAGVLALDLSLYVQHRILHAIPLLWRIHRIHHSDLDFDCATAFRHHPFESVIGHAFQIGFVLALGVSPVAVLVSQMLEGALSVFNHGNLALPPRVDARLRRILVTPDMHRIHHSVLVAEGNSNFANLFSWWDRLFSTYRADPIRGQVRMELGIARARNPRDVGLWNLLLLPFRGAEEVDTSSAEPASANSGGMS